MTIAPTGAPVLSPQAEPGAVRRRYRVANTVVAATILVVVLVFSLLAYLTWEAHSRTLAQGEERARTAAQLLSARTHWILGSGLSLLDLLSRDAAALPAAAAGQAIPPALRLAEDQVTLELYDAAGRLVAGVAESGFEDISEREFYASLRDGREWIVSPRVGAPGVVLARAVLRNGQFGGVLALLLDKSVFDVIWQTLGLPPGSTISLVRDDGEIIVRNPAPEGPVNLAGTRNFELITAADSGSYVSDTSPVDGVARIVAFQHVPDFGLIAIGSVSRGEALASLWRSLTLVLIMMVPVAVAAMAGAIVTARLLRRSARTQQRLEAALEHNELLFHEIHHRVKNNLQSVSSLLQMQPIPREVKVDMSQRIAAMAAIHEQIYSSSNFETVEMRRYLKNLLMGLKSSYESKAEVVEDLEDLEVDRETATSLGLIVNEVVSNAYKHAFPDGRPGRVSIALRREGAGRGVLEIADDGVGITAQEGRPKGIGRRLISSLSEQIGGVATYEAEGGTRFTLNFPLTAEAPGKATAGARVTTTGRSSADEAAGLPRP